MSIDASAPRAGGLDDIVLTGGPCAGKSTALEHLREVLSARGYRVIVCPEAATLVIRGGLPDLGAIGAIDPETYGYIQREILRLITALRGSYLQVGYALAAAGHDVVVLHDRGEPDMLLYAGEPAVAAACAAMGATIERVRDSYGAVVCLESIAALHPEQYNPVGRVEATAEQAVRSDSATLAAWSGHPRLVRIDATDDLEAKLAAIDVAVLDLLEGAA